jgi:hypothetical protein
MAERFVFASGFGAGVSNRPVAYAPVDPRLDQTMLSDVDFAVAVIECLPGSSDNRGELA